MAKEPRLLLLCPVCGHQERVPEASMDAGVKETGKGAEDCCCFCGSYSVPYVLEVRDGWKNHPHRRALGTVGRFAGRQTFFADHGLVCE